MASTQDIKALREETGVSVMDVKRALEEAGGDAGKAREILKERGVRVAQKKAGRETHAGIVDAYVHAGGKTGALVLLLCETDFVARSDDFKELARDIAMHVTAMNPAGVKELLSQPFIKDESVTVKERVEQAVAKLGENITVAEFTRFEL